MKLSKKYKDKIYTQNGERNLRTVKSIAIEAGLIKPDVYRVWTFKFLYKMANVLTYTVKPLKK